MRHVIVRLNADGKTGVVINAHEIACDHAIGPEGIDVGGTKWFPPKGCISIPAVSNADANVADKGSQFDGANFSAPSVVDTPVAPIVEAKT